MMPSMLNLTMVMARSVMIALFPAVLPSCMARESQAEFWSNEREIIELSQQLKLGEYRLRLSETGQKKELDDLKILLSENEVRLLNLQSEKSALFAEIERLEARNRELSQAALEQRRARAQGMNFETFSAKDGRTFKNAIITVVDDSGVAFRHEHGAARLRYAELSEEQRQFFGLEEQASLAAEDRERRQALAYELSIDMELEAMRDHASEARAESFTARNHDYTASRALMAASNDHKEARPLAQPARVLGSGSSYRRWYGYSGYRSYRPVYRYVYQYPVQNPFCPAPKVRSPAPRAHRQQQQNPFCPTSSVRSQSTGYSSGTCPSHSTTTP